MTKTFKVPFATQGDRTSIPNEVQADGAVSYTQGYGYDYERDQVSDPAAKDIEREKMNGIFHDITEAVGEIQGYGFPKWAEEGKPYPIRAIVYHKNKVWQSKVENNEVEPVTGAQWAELKADLTAGDIGVYNKTESDKRFQPLGNYQAAGYSYSKQESDTNYQPKGNYAPAANYAMKGDSYTKAEGDGRYQPKGNYQPAGDYATNAALNNGLALKFDKTGGVITGNVSVKSEYIEAVGSNSTIRISPYQTRPMISTNVGNGLKSHEFQDKPGVIAHVNTLSKGDNGYEVDNNTGLITQWGRVSSLSAGNGITVQFPIQFTSKCVNVSAVLIRTSPTETTSHESVFSSNPSTAGFTIYKSGSATLGAFWIARGY